MVVIGLPATAPTRARQERTGWPSTSTVQAPQRPSPQPYLAPVRSRSSRRTLSKVRSASASMRRLDPLTRSSVTLPIGDPLGVDRSSRRVPGSRFYPKEPSASRPRGSFTPAGSGGIMDVERSSSVRVSQAGEDRACPREPIDVVSCKPPRPAARSLGLGDLGFLSRLRPVSADEARLDPKVVRLQPEIEPLVRLLEETPRERLLEEVAGRIKQGTELSRGARGAAAGRRAERPAAAQRRPQVPRRAGRQLGPPGQPRLARPDRWLPIFWALDYFKSSQAQDVREGNWTMGPVDESAVPPARKAREAFVAAMDRWDEAAADAAVAGLARSAGANEVYELFFRYGARDFRSIGHKAIYVANSWRTLQCIGWQHAEPVLRSLAYALLMHEGDNPAERDDPADRPWRRNQELARADQGGLARRASPTRRRRPTCSPRSGTGSDDDACEQVVELLNRGVAPQSIWDALFDGAGELLMRQPGIVALHAVDHDQRPALRLPGQRRRRDPPAAAAPERRVPAAVPRRDGRPRQGRRRPDRPARAARHVGGRPGGRRGDLRRGRAATATSAARKALAYLQDRRTSRRR